MHDAKEIPNGPDGKSRYFLAKTVCKPRKWLQNPQQNDTMTEKEIIGEDVNYGYSAEIGSNRDHSRD